MMLWAYAELPYRPGLLTLQRWPSDPRHLLIDGTPASWGPAVGAEGTRLLDRTPKGTRLTPAGQTFLPQAQALLHAARQAELAVREQAQTQRIAIGYVEDLVITPAVRELRRHHPDAEITTRHLNCRDVGALSDKRVDALIARAQLPLVADDVFTSGRCPVSGQSRR
ncbi:DNA-binding transcriptional LysR family regulator [Streptomyces sp. SAI-208]|uniref:LysR family transcriptional regulator n=1 Tax=Streptomyces sp. SAI-208 TaxID=2940550 RepID=UPI0024771F69|nr:LysR family transcriptional regulator [Streptomyces sp. SAI-208]MDH6604581.1 DNA-binding transcriptional LysR family regulator [Streptomyces sp. SAI-208]